MMNTTETTLVFLYCVICFGRTAETENPDPQGPDEAYGALFDVTGYPRHGDIPVLNRKIFRGTRVSITEHPYIVSIRRQLAHFLTGTLISKSLVLTVAHPLHLVPIYELGVVVGENYADRGTSLMNVILVVEHELFDPYTLKNDIAILKIFEDIPVRYSVKPIVLIGMSKSIAEKDAFVTGWGRCDTTGTELCLPRGSIYYPGETLDPMLRSIVFQITLPNYYCDGYKRQDVTIHPGMLCVGVAREENSVTPCLAVPGAPLVINGYVAGIQSWGFGCGYSHDLPLVYTNLKYHRQWVVHNIQLLEAIGASNFTELFQATKSYISCEWLQETRFLQPEWRDFPEELIPKELDTHLARLKGHYYDIRDFVFEGRYRESKLRILNKLRDRDYITEKYKFSNVSSGENDDDNEDFQDSYEDE